MKGVWVVRVFQAAQEGIQSFSETFRVAFGILFRVCELFFVWSLKLFGGNFVLQTCRSKIKLNERADGPTGLLQ